MNKSESGKNATDDAKQRPQVYLREALLLTGVVALSLAAAKTQLFHLVFYWLGSGFVLASIPLALLTGVFLIVFRWKNPQLAFGDSRNRMFASWMWIVFVTAGVLLSLIKDWNMANQFGAHSFEIIMLAGVFSIGAAISFPLVFFNSTGLKQLINAMLVWLIGILFCSLLLLRTG